MSGEDRFGVELHPPVGPAAVAHAHQRAVVAPGERLELGRQLLLAHLEAVVAGGLERVGQTFEDAQGVARYNGAPSIFSWSIFSPLSPVLSGVVDFTAVLLGTFTRPSDQAGTDEVDCLGTDGFGAPLPKTGAAASPRRKAG